MSGEIFIIVRGTIFTDGLVGIRTQLSTSRIRQDWVLQVKIGLIIFLLKSQAGICMPGLILQTSKNKLSMLGSKASKQERQTENTKGFPSLFRQRITVKSLLTSKEEASPNVTSDVKPSSCLSDINPLLGHMGDHGCLIIGFHFLLSQPTVLQL